MPRLLYTFALVALLAGAARAQSFSDGFSFYLPPDDTTAGPWRPAFSTAPLAPDAFVTASADGHFSIGGQPVRFFGVNCTADGCFPDRADAPFVAGRMAAFGINLVRLHFLDNSWGGRSLLAPGNTRRLQADGLDKLHYFVAQLARRGVRVDLNLLVGRRFARLDGVPSPDSLPDMAKGVALFDPQLLALQKEYARQLLTAPNPYTGLPLARDPALALVEIANENSLYALWRSGELAPQWAGGRLSGRHARMLASQFNAWLARRYPAPGALADAWNPDAAPEGATLVTNGGFENPLGAPWALEQHAPALATATRDVAESAEGAASARIDVAATDGEAWHVQWKHTGLSLEKGRRYTVRFRARASTPRTVGLYAMLDVSPWSAVGGTDARVTADWQPFSFTFLASETRRSDVRLSFQLGAATGSVWIDGVVLAPAGQTGLDSGEAVGTVQLVSFADRFGRTPARVADQTAFLVDVQQQFFGHMRAFLRDTLGVRVPISGTNWNFGLPDLAVQHDLDYVDNHAYWDHPDWPGTPWTATGWRIANTPMVLQQGGATMAALFGGIRAAGKPYTISEYNHAFPNQSQAEFPLFLGAYGAFHGADALMLYSYNHRADWREDWQNQFFDLHRNTPVMALVPSIAMAYRMGYVAPADVTTTLAFAPSDVARAPLADVERWPTPRPVPGPQALVHRYDTRLDADAPFDPNTVPPAPAPPYTSDTGELVWNPERGLFRVETPLFVGMTGLLDRQTGAQAGPATLVSASGPATWTWIALDSLPLATGRRSLVTLATALENTGMAWTGTTTVDDRWGRAPTLVRPARLALRLALDADSLHLVPLDRRGQPQGAPQRLLPDADGAFALLLDTYATPAVWWGVEAFGATGTARLPDARPSTLTLDGLAPQPFGATARLTLGLPAPADVRVALFDVMGRRVWTYRAALPAGRQQIPIDAANLAPGVYAVQVEAGADRLTFVAVHR